MRHAIGHSVFADVFNLRKCIASETAIKLTLKGMRILRRHGRD